MDAKWLQFGCYKILFHPAREMMNFGVFHLLRYALKDMSIEVLKVLFDCQLEQKAHWQESQSTNQQEIAKKNSNQVRNWPQRMITILATCYVSSWTYSRHIPR